MILLRVPGTLEYRSLAMQAISEACRIAQGDDGWDGAGLETYALSAFGEAFNNIAIHGYGEGPPGEVTLEVRWGRDELVIQVTDDGQSFDPDNADPPDLDALPDALPEGGMGLYIMHSFMDEVHYQAGPPNILRLTKRREGGSSTGGENLTPLPRQERASEPSLRTARTARTAHTTKTATERAKIRSTPLTGGSESNAESPSLLLPLLDDTTDRSLSHRRRSDWQMKAVSSDKINEQAGARGVGGSRRP